MTGTLQIRAFVCVLITLIAAAIVFDTPGWLSGDGLRTDASIDGLIDPAELAATNARGVVFGETERVFIGLMLDDTGGEPTFDELVLVERIAATLEALKFVHSVAALTRVLIVEDTAESLDLAPLLSRLRAAPDSVSARLKPLQTDPLVSGNLISEDGRGFGITLRLADNPSPLQLQAIREHVQAQMTGYPRVSMAMTGPPVLKSAASGVLVKQLSHLVPLIFAVILLLLAFAFRHWAAVVWPAVTIGMALIWTFSAMAALDISVNLVTVVAPPLVMTLGLAYAMHFLSAFVVTGSAAKTVTDLSRAVWLTGLTTGIGLLALLISPVPAIREFAVVSAIGVMSAAILTLAFLPGVLQIAGPSHGLTPRVDAQFKRLADWLGDFDVRFRRVIIAGSMLLLVLLLLLASRIQTGTELLSGLPNNSTAAKDFRTLNTRFGGSNRFSIVIDTQVDGGLLQETNRAVMRDLQQWLSELPDVGQPASVLDYADKIRQSFGQDPREPTTERALRQMLVFAGPDGLYDTTDPQFRTGRIMLSTSLTDTARIAEIVDQIEARLRRLPQPLQAGFSGSSVTLALTVKRLATGQATSLLAALLAIFAMLAVVFGSLRAAALAMLPNALPVAAYFGLLGATGTPLGPTTSLVACIVLGIAVDDTLHYLLRFNDLARHGGCEEAAARHAIRSVIRPITLTTITLCAGFLLFTTSPLSVHAQFGLLAATTLLFAWFTDVVVTPALGSGVRVVTLWDLVRLDLGEAPQASIPLLAGLTTRQARTFALLSNLQTVPSGTRVIEQGREATDIYVVIDGQLSVTQQQTGGGTIEVAQLNRGDVIGEVGLFGVRRTAHVDTLKPTRLLRFTDENLAHILLRHPRIAAHIYRNLNHIQAARRASMTDTPEKPAAQTND